MCIGEREKEEKKDAGHSDNKPYNKSGPDTAHPVKECTSKRGRGTFVCFFKCHLFTAECREGGGAER